MQYALAGYENLTWRRGLVLEYAVTAYMGGEFK